MQGANKLLGGGLNLHNNNNNNGNNNLTELFKFNILHWLCTAS